MRILHCVLILAFAILLKNVCPQAPALIPSPAKVTSFLLAVQWPQGVCTGNSGVKCEISPVPTEFKIHGLWQQYDVKDPPIAMKSNETYNANELTPITTALNNNWPNLKSKQQQVSINLIFWGAEWTKHGIFSGMGVREYFQKTLQLYGDVGQGLRVKLAAESITPNNFKTYKLQAIEAALKKINGNFSVTIICNQRNTSKKEKQIQEIRFKYTPDFKKQNNVASSTCGSGTTDVMFPALT